MEDKRKEIVGNVIRIQRYHSPCGDLMLGSFEDRLCLCDWAVENHRDIVDRRLPVSYTHLTLPTILRV